METKERNPNSEQTTVRVIGKIAKDVESHTGKSGKEFYKFSIVVSDGFGSETWVNATMFPELFAMVPRQLLSKGAYAKFIGRGSTRPWTDKEGKQRSSNDLLVQGVELQDGTFIKGLRLNEQSKNEDAPF